MTGQRDERAPIQIFAEYIKRAISSNGASPIPGGPGFDVKNVRRNTQAARNLGILIGAIIVALAGISLLIHNATSGSSWKTMSCAQFLHESPGQQQAIVNELQSTFHYYNQYSGPETVSGLSAVCGPGYGNATLLSIVQM